MKYFLYTSILSNGGAERVLCELANNLYMTKENDVYLIASYETQKEYYINPHIKKYYLDKDLSNKKSFKQIFKLRQLIKREKPDIIVSFLPNPNFKMLIACLGVKVKKVISIRNDPNIEYSPKGYKMMAKILYPLADGIVFQTNDAKVFFSNRIQKKSQIIMNQVNEHFFECEHDKEDYYISIGRIDKQKNYELLIAAFSEFIKLGYNERLYIFGKGEKAYNDKLNKIIKENGCENNIFLKGITDDVSAVLRHAKCFIMTSLYEGMPNALLEAMAVGLPCISTDCPCGGPRMIIENNINGFLFQNKNKNELVNLLIKVNSDSKLRRKIGDNARISSYKFKPDIIFKSWLEFFKNI